MPVPEQATVCVVGGGPAGLMLGLLLARGGVRVAVLEKHSDFLRDFRGDTVHASTLTLLDELGLGAAFAALPQRRVSSAAVDLDAGTVRIADLSHLPGAHQQIALVPQWDLLELLARSARAEPTFSLHRDTEVLDVVRDRTGVRGVRWRGRGAKEGTSGEMTADLVVACDGRDSVVRRSAGMSPRKFGVPMDVEWFRLSRRPSDPDGLLGRISPGRMSVLIDRGTYWQCAYLVPKGADARLRTRPVGEFAGSVAGLMPWLSDRTGELTSWDDVRLLSVSLNRVRRWYDEGLLLIGDAAHAMSPIGGVGINLAVQDAVAAARIIGDALRQGRSVDLEALRAVQRRRLLPTVLVQTVQRIGHRVVIGRALRSQRRPRPWSLSGVEGSSATSPSLPLPLRLWNRWPRLHRVPARLIAIGPLPEHAPQWARRPSIEPGPAQ